MQQPKKSNSQPSLV